VSHICINHFDLRWLGHFVAHHYGTQCLNRYLQVTMDN